MPPPSTCFVIKSYIKILDITCHRHVTLTCRAEETVDSHFLHKKCPIVRNLLRPFENIYSMVLNISSEKKKVTTFHCFYVIHRLLRKEIWSQGIWLWPGCRSSRSCPIKWEALSDQTEITTIFTCFNPHLSCFNLCVYFYARRNGIALLQFNVDLTDGTTKYFAKHYIKH